MYSFEQLAEQPAPCNHASHGGVCLTGTPMSFKPHICAFFKNRTEEYQAVLPFMQEGLAQGEKTFYTVDPSRMEDHLQRLAAGGVDSLALRSTGQMEICDWNRSHTPDQRFNAERTVGFYEQVTRESARDGFALTRFVTHMEWALDTLPDSDDLLEYEARANLWWMNTDGPRHPVICTYDLTRFSADFIADVVRTHPLIILGGIIQENPFFVPPAEFLQDLHARWGGR